MNAMSHPVDPPPPPPGRKPEPPAWGTLLKRALKESGLSARAAARLTGLSEARWRQLCQGYQTVGGQYISEKGPPGTIARMAATVGVTPAQLTQAGRPDAATALARQTGDSSAYEELLRKVQAMSPQQARNLLISMAGALNAITGPQPADDDEEGTPERRYGT